MFDLGKLVTLGASQRAGALFGVADISNGDIVVQGGTYKSKFTLPEEVSFNGSYGGLVGKVFATAKGVDESLRAFVVQKDADKKTCSIEFELAGKLSDTGGVVGYVGDSADSNSQPVAVVLDGVTVACKGDASARTDAGSSVVPWALSTRAMSLTCEISNLQATILSVRRKATVPRELQAPRGML